MSDAGAGGRSLGVPRGGDGLATAVEANRRLAELLPAFLTDAADEAGADRLVVPLDGGVGSTVAAAVAVDAVGPGRVTGVVAPAGLTDEAPARDAEAVASMLGIDARRLQVQPLVTAFGSVVGMAGEPAEDTVALANAAQRFRMTCVYYVANTAGALVVGSADRTERLLGTVTKYGETGVDLALLGDLYRTEVTALADHLDVPADIREGPRRRTDHGPTDAERLGVGGRTLDRVLRLGVDEGRDAAAVADRIGVEPAVVERAKRWCANTRHKRRRPPTPSDWT